MADVPEDVLLDHPTSTPLVIVPYRSLACCDLVLLALSYQSGRNAHFERLLPWGILHVRRPCFTMSSSAHKYSDYRNRRPAAAPASPTETDHEVLGVRTASEESSSVQNSESELIDSELHNEVADS